MKLLRINQVQMLTGYSKTTIYDYMKKGEFPYNIKVGSRSARWIDSEVLDWVAATRNQRIKWNSPKTDDIECILNKVFY